MKKVLIFLLMVSLTLALTGCKDGTIPTLNGNAEETIEVGTTWTDPGVSDSEFVTVSGTVDTETIGTYVLTYSYDINGTTGSFTRTIYVVDTTIPVITLTGDDVELELDETYTEQGATALDNYDGDISDDIVIADNIDTSTPGTYQVTYNVSDSSGNEAQTVTRTVVVLPSDTAPVISIIGDSMIYVFINTTWNDPGATANDEEDGDITTEITITDTVDITTVGTYTVSYNVQDSDGNLATMVTRTVIVYDDPNPEITLTGDNPLELYVGDTYTEPGYTAFDKKDGDITDDVVIQSNVDTSTPGTYTVTYTVTDSDSNEITVTRTVNVSIMGSIPVITLNGDAVMNLMVGDTFTEPGYIANDSEDGLLTTTVNVTGTVNTSVPGTYFLYYDVTDSDMNEAEQVMRTVVVTAPVSEGYTHLYLQQGIDMTVDAALNDHGLTPQTPTSINTDVLGEHEVLLDDGTTITVVIFFVADPTTHVHPNSIIKLYNQGLFHNEMRLSIPERMKINVTMDNPDSMWIDIGSQNFYTIAAMSAKERTHSTTAIIDPGSYYLMFELGKSEEIFTVTFDVEEIYEVTNPSLDLGLNFIGSSYENGYEFEVTQAGTYYMFADMWEDFEIEIKDASDNTIIKQYCTSTYPFEIEQHFAVGTYKVYITFPYYEMGIRLYISDQTPSNTSPDTAEIIAINQEVDVTLLPGMWYAFTITTKDYYELVENAEQFWTEYNLYDDNFNRLGYFGDGVLLEPGTYYLNTMYGSSTATFTIQPTTTNFNTNTTAAYASPISFPETVIESFTVYGEDRWYTFTLTEEKMVHIFIDSEFHYDGQITLYDETFKISESNRNEVYSNLPAGTYYIRLYGYPGNTYELNTEFVTMPLLGDNATAHIQAEFDTNYQEYIHHDEIHYYDITLTEETVILFSTYVANRIHLKIYNDSGVVVFMDDYNWRTFASLPTGNYTITLETEYSEMYYFTMTDFTSKQAGFSTDPNNIPIYDRDVFQGIYVEEGQKFYTKIDIVGVQMLYTYFDSDDEAYICIKDSSGDLVECGYIDDVFPIILTEDIYTIEIIASESTLFNFDEYRIKDLEPIISSEAVPYQLGEFKSFETNYDFAYVEFTVPEKTTYQVQLNHWGYMTFYDEFMNEIISEKYDMFITLEAGTYYLISKSFESANGVDVKNLSYKYASTDMANAKDVTSSGASGLIEIDGVDNYYTFYVYRDSFMDVSAYFGSGDSFEIYDDQGNLYSGDYFYQGQYYINIITQMNPDSDYLSIHVQGDVNAYESYDIYVNNTFDTAYPIRLNDYYSSKIIDYGDQAWFTFDVDYEMMIYMQGNCNSGHFEYYDNTGTLIYDDVNSDTRLFEPGTYYLKLSCDIGYYSFNLQGYAYNDVSDTSAGAMPIHIEGYVYRKYFFEDEVDEEWYTFTITEPQLLYLSVSYADIELYDSDIILIDSNTYGMQKYLEAGTYYIKLTNDYTETHYYTFYINNYSHRLLPGSFADAYEIELGESMEGHKILSTEDDYVKFYVTMPLELDISTGNTYEIYDSTETLYTATTLIPGTYYLVDTTEMTGAYSYSINYQYDMMPTAPVLDNDETTAVVITDQYFSLNYYSNDYMEDDYFEITVTATTHYQIEMCYEEAVIIINNDSGTEIYFIEEYYKQVITLDPGTYEIIISDVQGEYLIDFYESTMPVYSQDMNNPSTIDIMDIIEGQIDDTTTYYFTFTVDTDRLFEFDYDNNIMFTIFSDSTYTTDITDYMDNYTHLEAGTYYMTIETTNVDYDYYQLRFDNYSHYLAPTTINDAEEITITETVTRQYYYHDGVNDVFFQFTLNSTKDIYVQNTYCEVVDNTDTPVGTTTLTAGTYYIHCARTSEDLYDFKYMDVTNHLIDETNAQTYEIGEVMEGFNFNALDIDRFVITGLTENKTITVETDYGISYTIEDSLGTEIYDSNGMYGSYIILEANTEYHIYVTDSTGYYFFQLIDTHMNDIEATSTGATSIDLDMMYSSSMLTQHDKDAFELVVTSSTDVNVLVTGVVTVTILDSSMNLYSATLTDVTLLTGTYYILVEYNGQSPIPYQFEVEEIIPT